MDQDTLNQLFEKSQKSNPEKIAFSEDESLKFRKAFEDPEFRKLFSEYVDEMQDPKNREENEAYITQLENEKKVPEGKELIRPEGAFVAKTHKIKENGVTKHEKVFINVVHSSKIAAPTKNSTAQGNCWSVPYSLGPPHMEKDKKGDNAPCFDCCFHPDAVAMGRSHREFRDLLVHTAMEGVELTYKNNQRQEVVLDRSFHLVMGCTYKQGQVLTMMIPIAAKGKWSEQPTKASADQAKDGTAKLGVSSVGNGGPSTGSRATAATESSSAASIPESTINSTGSDISTKKDKNPRPAIKKGFLNNSKSAGLYDDKLTTIRGRSKVSSGGPLVNFKVDADEFDDTGKSDATGSSTDRSGGEKLVREIEGGGATSVRTAQPVVSDQQQLLVARSTVKKVAVAAVAETTPVVVINSSVGPAIPVYSVKERGVVDMGDFETMRRRTIAGASRPSELVYRVELPLVSKASQVVLDVAERRLSLQYLNIYALNVPLPYPVWDTKGTAKFDKATKNLTITLPVVQQEVQQVVTRSSDERDDHSQSINDDQKQQQLQGKNNAIPSADVNVSDCSQTHDGVDTNHSTNNNISGNSIGSSNSHSRWGSGGRSSTDTNGGDGAPSLLNEIQLKARLAVEEAQRSAAQQQTTSGVVTVTPSVSVISTIETGLISPADCNFEASATFKGRRSGKVFMRGESGLGYYLDPILIAQRSTERQLSVDDSATASSGRQAALKQSCQVSSAPQATEIHPFEFQLQQTRPAIALLVQVADILKDTVSVVCHDYSINVHFRAACAAKSSEATNTQQQTSRAYGLTVSFPQALSGRGLDAARCTWDVAARNMVVVLEKRVPGMWLGEGVNTTSEGDEQQLHADVPHSTSRLAAAVATDVDCVVPLTDLKASDSSCNSNNDTLVAMESLRFSSASSQALYDLD